MVANMTLWVRVGLIAQVLLSTSCAYTDADDTDTDSTTADDTESGREHENSAANDDACTAPLSEYCTDCKSFDDQISHNQSLSFGGAGAFECPLTGDKTVFVVWTAGDNESPDPQHYFDSETGDLIAVRMFSDVPQYCADSSAEILYGSLPGEGCDVSAHISEIEKSCYRPWTDENFEWTAEKCQAFEID